MKKMESADPLLDEVEEAQRRLEAEFDNDPAKLLAHYQEVQKRYADRLISRRAPGQAAREAPAEKAVESNKGKSAA